MKVVVFVPGIMGTSLHNTAGEELWPPQPLETKLGYKRMDKLLGDDVTHGDIIQNVWCVDFYGSMFKWLKELNYLTSAPDQRLVTFPYDWRLDLADTSQRLADEIDRIDAPQLQEIHLIAHSMGGLITRLLLEGGKFSDKPWFNKIRSFIALAVPHQGAPLALARILGLDSDMGISKSDFRKLANDRRYPSGYQLLPAPDEAACWDETGARLEVADIYDSDVAGHLGLDPQLLSRARFVHDTLRAGAPPKHVRYFYFAGTGHETVTRINVVQDKSGNYPTSAMAVTRTEGAGDGTVPMWSALPRAVQKQVVVNEHSHVFTGVPFRKVFYRLLGGNLGSPLEALLEKEPVDPLRLSIPKPVIEAGKTFELLLIPPMPTAPLKGVLRRQKLNEDGSPDGSPHDVSKLEYDGVPVSDLRLTMPPMAEPGWFELRFVGTPTNSTPVRFAVAQLPD
jgi:pimeloyl-ACP methyl ester carboxylesterase